MKSARASGTTYYGNSINAGTLNNSPMVGGQLYANRIMFPKAGNIVSVKKYLVGRDGGYGAGTGGYITYELRTDDGTANHFPTNTILGSTPSISAANARSKAYFPVVNFTSYVPVKANTWYHLVAYNTDSDPNANYVSQNDLWDGQIKSTKVRNQVIPEKQFSVLYKSGGGWATAENHTSIVEFAYDDGTHFGMGYMEISSTADNTYMHIISGSNKVRQTFTPVTDTAVSALFVSLWRRSGSSPITATLTSSQGTVSSTNNSAPIGGFGRSKELYNQDFVAFDLCATLKSGVTYYLELSAPSDTVYMISGLRDGNAGGNGFDKATVFADGWAQYTTDGSNWIDWETWGTPNNDQDLSFYFLP